jgi:hypothetical protein
MDKILNIVNNFDDFFFRFYHTDSFLGFKSSIIFLLIVILIIFLINQFKVEEKFDKYFREIKLHNFGKVEKKIIIIFFFALFLYLLHRITHFNFFFIFGEAFLVITKFYMIYLCYTKLFKE